MTNRVKVELIPPLQRFRDKTNFSLELPDDTKVSRMLAKIGFREDEIKQGLMIFVNNKWASLDKTLKANDEIWVGFVVGGG